MNESIKNIFLIILDSVRRDNFFYLIKNKFIHELREDFVDFKGKYYELEKAFLRPRPAVPVSETEYRSTVPLFIAASSPRTMKVTAQYGDGWLPANLVPKEYKSNLEKIRETAKKFGRDPLSIEPAHFMYVVVAEEA